MVLSGMNECFLIQVMTGKEELYRRHFEKICPDTGIVQKLIIPKRELTLRKGGKLKKEVNPIFPGYIFWECESPHPDVRWAVRKTPGFVRLIRTPEGPLVHLNEEERQIIKTLTGSGEVARKSTIIFDKNNRVKVLSGPMMGQEGNIIKVDRRKKRARVRYLIHDKYYSCDLEFEILEKQSE